MHKPDTSDHSAGLSIRRSVQLSHFSKRVTCKLAKSYVERDAIFKLRYQSYFRAGLVSENSFGRHIEPADHADNTYLMGLRIDRKLVSSLRLQIGSLATTPDFSSRELFPDGLDPILRNDKTVIDMSCVAADGELPRPYVWLPYMTLRYWIMAAEHFQADYIAAAVRPQHQVFYQRVLNCELHPELRLLPTPLASVGLVSLNFATSAKRLYENLPFLRSTPSERERLFERDTPPPKVTGLHHSMS